MPVLSQAEFEKLLYQHHVALSKILAAQKKTSDPEVLKELGEKRQAVHASVEELRAKLTAREKARQEGELSENLLEKMGDVLRYLGEVSVHPLNTKGFPASQEQVSDNIGLPIATVQKLIWSLKAVGLTDVEKIEGRLFASLTKKGRGLYQLGVKEAMTA
jgi:biotin operon repressor